MHYICQPFFTGASNYIVFVCSKNHAEKRLSPPIQFAAKLGVHDIQTCRSHEHAKTTIGALTIALRALSNATHAELLIK